MTNQNEERTVKAFGMTDPRSATITKDVKTKMGLAFRKGEVVTVYNGGVIGSGPYTGQTSYSAYSSRNDVMTAIRPIHFRLNPTPAYAIFDMRGACRGPRGVALCGNDRMINKYGRCIECQAELQSCIEEAEEAAGWNEV